MRRTIASSADRRALLIENDNIIGEGPLSVSGDRPIGNHVFTLQATDASSNLQWIGVSRSSKSVSPALNEASLLSRMTTSNEFAATMKAKMHPGMVLVLTDAPLQPDKRSGRDFVVMSADG